jgi:hypothetical protein
MKQIINGRVKQMKKFYRQQKGKRKKYRTKFERKNGRKNARQNHRKWKVTQKIME